MIKEGDVTDKGCKLSTKGEFERASLYSSRATYFLGRAVNHNDLLQ
jgi:hypothetical protein